MSRAAIEVQNFSYRIRNVPILRNITFEVPENGFLSIVGPNGAGKTTLLKCLNRIYTGGEGRIRIHGNDLSTYPQKALAQRIAYVPQANGRQLPFTVFEFALLARYPYLSPFSAARKEDRQAVHDALALTDMKSFAERPLNTLSGGEQQKVFITAALAQQAGIMLLDEPTTFLDPLHQADIFRILKRINAEAGATIVMVTHDINSAVLISDRILALRNGQVMCCKNSAELMENGLLSRIYGKEFVFMEHPRTGQKIVAPEGAP
ncbi:MAG: ABC transporter ATP-binding protein [Planctomycetota bacterium]